MTIFFSYLFLGLSLSAPIGPINAAQLDRGIKNGFLHAWVLGIGALLADVTYMVLVYLGVVHFLSTPFMQTFLWLFGCFVLIYTGVESIISARRSSVAGTRGIETLSGSFVSGFLMSISNPMTILFWLGIYGSVLAKTAAMYGAQELLLYSVAIILGILIWDLIMASISSFFRAVLTPRSLVAISVVSGISLIVFGLYFGFQAFRAIFG